MLKKLLLTACFVLPFMGMMGQAMTVSGVVTGPDGDPLAGVSVSEKGTSNGIFSNLDGEFTLVVKSGATVIFRMEGMRSVEKEATSSMDIAMEELAIPLDEVVIAALGIATESKVVGYSVQTVDGADVVRSGEVNSIAGLSGKVAGVQVINSSGTPGGSAFIRIRGSRSLDGENQPLIVVDGVPMNNDMHSGGNPDNGTNALLDGVAQSNRAIDINPDDIETVTVLKGPNASALYGIAAANGAIVITTKRGKAETGRTISVAYSASFGIDQVNRLPKLQNQFSQGSLDGYRGPETFTSGSWGAMIDSLYWNGDGTYLFDQNGDIVGQSDPSAGTKVTPYDNLGTFFQNGTTFSNNLSFSGGSNAATYRFSIGNTNQTGIVPNSDFQRTSLRFNSDAQLSKRLKSGVSLSYTHSGGTRIQQGSNTSGLMLGLLRTPPTFDNSNGSDDPANDPTSYIFEIDGSQRNYRGGFGYDNPYWAVNKSPFTDDVNRFFGSTSLSYEATKWLNIFYRAGTDAYADNRQQIFDINSRTSPQGRMYRQSHIYRHINSDLWITAKHSFGDNFSGSVLLGNNIYDQHYNRMYTQGDGFVLPDYYNFANVTSVLSREFNSRYRKAAIFADVKMAYKNMLFLDITARNEWSSTLPQSKRNFLYPSISSGFIFTDALGWTDKSKILPYGKIRASFAQVGQDAPVYSLKNYYTTGFAGDGWTGGISWPINGVGGFMTSDQLGNPNLRPEKTNSIELGTDLRFVNGRIGIDFTYYSTTSVDQILAVPVAASSGFLTEVMNAGKVTNKGIEIVLNATPVKSKNFRWDINLNWTRNRNMVVELADGIESLMLGGFEGTSIRNVAGQPFGQIYGLTWLRDANGNVVIESDPTKNFGYPIASGIEEVIGNPNPDWLAGLRNTLTWKGLNFSFLIDVRKGGDIWNGTQGALTFFGMTENTESRGEETVFEGVLGTVDGDGNLVTAGTTNTNTVVLDQAWYQGDGGGFGNVAEHFIQDGSFVKLRDIGLSYDIPTKVLRKSPIGKISVGVSARNFILWTAYEGIDPETNLMGSMNAQGLDYFNMPSTKSYLFSLNLGF
jgi:TonB-linked SusC/RagA family outer membrane protein